jgi:hypothetical protein
MSRTPPTWRWAASGTSSSSAAKVVVLCNVNPNDAVWTYATFPQPAEVTCGAYLSTAEGRRVELGP